MSTAVRALAAWLSERREFLHTLERKAERAIREEKDTEKYRALMREKAVFLQGLAEEAEQYLDDLPEGDADAVAERLERFSANASRALALDSVFYMYALLYPDDHQKGQPNDLDKLAAEVAAMQ